MNGLIRLRGGERLHVEELLPVGFAKLMQVVDQLQLEGELLSSAVETSDGFEVIAIEHLDFDVSCTAKYDIGPDCNRTAVWSVVCASCGRQMGLSCEECRQTVRVSENVYRDACGFQAVYPDLVRFVPLGGS